MAITHPDLAAQWHPTKNGELTPIDVTSLCELMDLVEDDESAS